MCYYYSGGPISDKTLSPKTYPTPLTIQHLTLCLQPKTFSAKPRPKPKTLMLTLDLNPIPLNPKLSQIPITNLALPSTWSPY